MRTTSTYRKLALQLLLSFLFFSASAQLNYTISNFTVNDGLPQSTVYSMIQDQRGFIWFSTYGGGLCRFDGVNFKTFTEQDSLVDSKIYKVLEDSKGNIWIGGRKGISLYDGYSFKKIDIKVKSELPQVRDIYEDQLGNIWAATYGSGLIKINGSKVTVYSTYDGLASDYIYSIEELDSKNLLLGTRNGISYFDGKRFTKFDGNNQHKHNSIRSILKSNSGIWYGAYGGGLCNINDSKHNCISLNGIKNKQNIMSIIESKNGDIWVSTFGEGIYKITKDSTYNLTITNSNLSTNNVLSLLEDDLGNIWAGTFLGGVCKISETAFYSFTGKNGLEDPSVENLYELKSEGILMTLMSGGLNVYSNGIISKHRHSDKINGVRITSIFEDSEGYVWLTTDGAGVFKYKGDNFEKLNVVNGKLPSDQIHTGMQSSDLSIWLGSYGDGIIRIKDGEIKQFKKEYERGLNSNQIMGIEEDSTGSIWFATNGGGITKYDGVNFQTFKLEVLDFVGVEKDLFNNLWFASNGGGVLKYDYRGEFQSFTNDNGLLSNNINLICFDNANMLWIGSEKGINKVIFEFKDTTFADGTSKRKSINYLVNNIESYNKEDGLIGVETNNGSVLKDQNGNMWFGTINGVSKYNPRADKFNIRPPKAQIIDLKLSNEPTDWSQYADSILPWSKLPIDLSLDYDKNHLTFEFVGINLNVPHGVTYKFILEGFEEEWNISKRDFITYSNIPPGDYIFKVLAQNEDGVWQQDPTQFPFTIRKPIWLQYWFIISAITFIVIVIYIVVKRREKEIKLRNILLEKTVNERTLELKKEKEKIENINIEVEKKNEQILDSIQYAKRIQMAILPPDEIVRDKLPDFNIFYEAKDIVSGDFYWLTEEEENVCFATVDCTGHGVPGAFMSIVGYRLLELIVNSYHITEPAKVLDELHMQVLETLHKQKGSAKDISDGMDIAFCTWNKVTNILKYSGAHNSLYLIRNGELEEYPANNRPIGMSLMKEFKNFEQHGIRIKEGDIVYIFTDGFADQFGGPNYRKYYYQNFQKFLLSISDLPMDKQKQLIQEEFFKWKGDTEQIDDVLVFGVKF